MEFSSDVFRSLVLSLSALLLVSCSSSPKEAKQPPSAQASVSEAERATGTLRPSGSPTPPRPRGIAPLTVATATPDAGFHWPYYLYVPDSWNEPEADRLQATQSAPQLKEKKKPKTRAKTKTKAQTQSKPRASGSSKDKKTAKTRKNADKQKKKSVPAAKSAKNKKPSPQPPPVEERKTPAIVRRLLVLPLDTGTHDDFKLHEQEVRRQLSELKRIGDELDVAVLRPVFPRTLKEPGLHTHSLDRDTMQVMDGPLRRLDLQVLAMVDHARERLERFKIETDPRVLIWGHSTSGAFVNRFTLLHPERVRAAAVGAPTGWFMLPVSRFSGKDLRYPIGTADLSGIAERSFYRQAFQQTPIFLYLGDKDKRDDVPSKDAFDPPDQELILSLFGRTPVERWAETVEHYRRAQCDCVFQLYEGLGHDRPDFVVQDVMRFLGSYVRD